MFKAIRYRAYPTQEQLVRIWLTIHSARAIYNIMLADKIAYYEANKAMLNNTPAQYKADRPWLKDADSSALANVQMHLEEAFRKFFNEPNCGFPNFKAREKSKKSYTTSRMKNNIRFDKNCLRLPKVGFVKIKRHRIAPSEWEIKSATVEITPTGKCFVSVLFKYENQVPKVTPVNILGLDYSSPYLYVDSNGNEPDYEKPFRKYQEKLIKEQRKLSKMLEANIKGYDSKHRPIWKRPLSDYKNLQKQKRKVALIYEKIANCRKDALHKLSYELAEKYDAIAVEDLNMRAMSQGLNLGKATMDNGYGMFVSFLKYKLEERGKELIVMNKWYPSTKTCSCCGNTKPMRLSDREYICPVCGLVIDRDHNAAINIRDEAVRLLAI